MIVFSRNVTVGKNTYLPDIMSQNEDFHTEEVIITMRNFQNKKFQSEDDGYYPIKGT